MRVAGIRPDLAVAAIPDDERVWVPQAPDVWFRPLLLNTVTGGWCNLLRVRKSGVLHRHRHPMLVTGYVPSSRCAGGTTLPSASVRTTSTRSSA